MSLREESAETMGEALLAAARGAGLESIPVAVGTVKYPTFVMSLAFFAAGRELGLVERHDCIGGRRGGWVARFPGGILPVVVDRNPALPGEVVRVEWRTWRFNP